MVLSDFEREVIAEVSKDRCWKHVEWFASVGEKLSGTPSNERSVDYILQELSAYGVETTAPEFQAWLSFPKMSDAEMIVLEPERKAINCIPFAQIRSSGDEGVEGELIYVGGGGIDDYKGKNAHNKIALAEFSKPPARPWKNYVAGVLNGAAGLIIISYPGPRKVLNRGTVKSVWGNPTPETFEDIGRIPAVNVANEDGLHLKDLLKQGSVRVWIKAKDTREWARTRQPMATVRGDEKQFVLLGSHMDAWAAAASCNAVGCASTLEIARVLKVFQANLRRGIELLWFQGHETGIMDGSSWYIDNFWDNLHGNCVAYFNNDTPCMINTTLYTARGNPIFHDFLESTVRDLAEAEDVPFKVSKTRYMPNKTGDQSFYGLGIPSGFIQTTYPPELEGKNPPGGWWYHSEFDTIDKCDPETTYMATKAQILVLLRLCMLPVLPFKVEPLANWTLEALKDLELKASKSIDLSSLIEASKEFKVEALRLDKSIERLNELCSEPNKAKLNDEIQSVNEGLMKICRLLNPINLTLHGKYGQDYYGAEYIKPIPILQEAIELAILNPDSSGYKALKTKLIRARNEVFDALQDSIWFTKNTSKIIKGIK